MTPDDELELLINAERSQAPSSARMEHELARLQEALGANVPPMDIGPVDPTLLVGSTTLGKLTTLAWVAKLTSVVAVVTSAGILVGNQIDVASPSRAPTALTSAPAPLPKSVADAPRASVTASLEKGNLPPLRTPLPSAGTPGTVPLTVASGHPRAAGSPPPATQAALAGTTHPAAAQGEAPSAGSSVKAFTDVPTSVSAQTRGFDAELELIKRAKAEVDSGRDHLAHGWLAQHAERFPAGVFAAEREGLAALLGCRANPATGRGAALTFLRSYPRSPLAARVRRTCGLE